MANDGSNGHYDGVKLRLDNSRVIKLTEKEAHGALAAIMGWKIKASRLHLEALKASQMTYIAHSMVWGRPQETHHESFEHALEFLKNGEDMEELAAERIVHPDGTVTTREQLANLI